MYDELEPYIVTNIVFANIVEDLLNFEFKPEYVYNIPGELKEGKNFEEFYIDKSVLYDTIVSIMYKDSQ